jgi:dTDP-4-amino-4,6-dideoxygalactose transaminase
LKINFNEPVFTEKGMEYINDAIVKNKQLNGDGPFTKRCSKWMEDNFKVNKVLLTTSCTHALEMSALLSEIKEGDEVIMPSFTFVSTADAFALRGARIKFIDIRPDTMNMDEKLIEAAITETTKVIVPVHYAGVACEMDHIMKLAHKYNLMVVEDAAQGVMAKYKERFLGTIGHLGSYSFHETKNYTMGEGGALLVNDNQYEARAEIIREKGTNRAQFFRGMVDKYSWVDIGSSYLPSEMNVAYLYAQLEIAEDINNYRINKWNRYYSGLKRLEQEGLIELPYIPTECEHNAHMFYIKVKDLSTRMLLMNDLNQKGIKAIFHYVPLHSSAAGLKYGEFIGEDRYTTKESDRLLRLPMYYQLTDDKIDYVIDSIMSFYHFD